MSGVGRLRPQRGAGAAPLPQSGAQTLAALGATAAQHGATAGRRHTRAETVSAGPSDLTGLVGSFHDSLLDEPIDSFAGTPSASATRAMGFLLKMQSPQTRQRRSGLPCGGNRPGMRKNRLAATRRRRLSCGASLSGDYSKRPQDTRRATPRQEGACRLPTRHSPFGTTLPRKCAAVPEREKGCREKEPPCGGKPSFLNRPCAHSQGCSGIRAISV